MNSAMLLALALMLPACQPGSGGPLEPVAGSGVTIQSDGVAMLVDGALETRVSGQWSSMNSNSLRIRYRNSGARPVRITLAGMQMQHSLGRALLSTATDNTGVDLTDKREDNDTSKVLFSLSGDGVTGPGVLELPAGATRDLDCSLTSFADTATVMTGDPIAVTIPLATRSIKVNFTAASPPNVLWQLLFG